MTKPTHEEIADLMNRTGTIELDGLDVQVRIKEVRPVFGRTDCLISPVSGSGVRWTDLRRISLDRRGE